MRKYRSGLLAAVGLVLAAVGGGLSNSALWALGVALLAVGVLSWLIPQYMPSRRAVEQQSQHAGAEFAAPASVSVRTLRQHRLLNSPRPRLTLALSYLFGGAFEGRLIIDSQGVAFRMPDEARRIGAADVILRWSEVVEWRVTERTGYLGDPGQLQLQLTGGRVFLVETRPAHLLRSAMTRARG